MKLGCRCNYHKGWAPLGVYANQPIPYMTFASASQFDVASSALLHDCENRWIVCSSTYGWVTSAGAEDDIIQKLIITSLCQWSEGDSFIMLRLYLTRTHSLARKIFEAEENYYNLQFWLSIISRSNEDKEYDKLLFLASVHGFNKTAVVLQWSKWGCNVGFL